MAVATGARVLAADMLLRLRGQMGVENITVTSDTDETQNVVFDVPFAATPNIFVNITNAAGGSAGWIARAINISDTDFDIFLQGTTTTFGFTVQWVAFEPEP